MHFKSQSYKKTMAAIAFTDGFASTLLNQFTDKSFFCEIEEPLKQIVSLCNSFLGVVPKLFGHKEVIRFNRNLKKLSSKFFAEKIDAIAYLTYAAFLLDEPIRMLKDEYFKLTLQTISDKLSEVLKVFEQIDNIDLETPFNKADEIRLFWEKLEW